MSLEQETSQVCMHETSAYEPLRALSMLTCFELRQPFQQAAINRELFSESEDGISDLDDDNQDNDLGSEGILSSLML
jgi:hypothetical protein